MSADISTIPSWKAALLERKRLHDKDLAASSAVRTPTVCGLGDDGPIEDGGVPSWKRDILARKQNQNNSSIFLARRVQTGDTQPNDNMSAVNNVHANHDALELHSAVVDINIYDVTEDQPVEERLLPIHQNPIFCLDRKQRHQSAPSPASARGSLSPRVASTSTGGSSHVHSSGLSSASSTHAPVTPDAVNEEVFSNDNDTETEVAYGKGFVHKLLMKFSHLSSSGGDQTTNNRYAKLRFGSLGDKQSGGTPRRQTSQDLESIHSTPTYCMPAAKFHSADDLLHESNFHVRIDRSDSSDELDITATNDINGEFRTHDDVISYEDGITSKRSSGSEECTTELPFANIVSTARSLFESLAVHSASQKQSLSPTSVHHASSSSHFSHVSTLERSHQPKSTVVTNTVVQEVRPPRRSDYSYGRLHQSVKSGAEEPLSNDTDSVPYGVESQKHADVRIESEASKLAQELSNRVTNGAADSISSIQASSHSPDSVHVRHIGNNPSTHPVSTPVDSGFSDWSISVTNSRAVEPERETVSTSQSNLAADDEGLMDVKSSTIENTHTIAAKTAHINTSMLSSQPADNKENVKFQPTLSVKKPAPSRPGKLSIRPASNLVAAKTSSEYLELTKYNDIRKGEFAPPLKKERFDMDMYEDDVDTADGVRNDAASVEKYVFTGAGVLIGRSLLTKTNKNKSVNTQNYFIIRIIFCGCCNAVK